MSTKRDVLFAYLFLSSFLTRESKFLDLKYKPGSERRFSS